MSGDRAFSSLSWVKYLLRNVTCLATCTYGRRKKRLGKDSMYMMTALWMEQSPWNFKYPLNRLNVVGDEDKLNVVGAVFVLPNDRVLSVDCSRRNNSISASQVEEDEGIVHGAVQALIKYPDRVKDCKVYLSRKPCAHCVKLLVQAAVEKVFYLPLRPEKCDEKEDNNIDASFQVSTMSKSVFVHHITKDEVKKGKEDKSIDALFQVSTVSKSVFVPYITKDDVKELCTELKNNPYDSCMKNLGDQQESYAKKEWYKWNKNIQEQLAWEEYGDEEIAKQVNKEMKNMLEWFGRATFATGRKEVMDWEPAESPSSSEKKELSKEVASHLSRLAQMLSNRTDDPKRNVGCVVTVEDEIVSIGWNGFPSKALYGNHPRGSRSDPDNVKSKYPHVIHAEQNALLCRNRRNLSNGIAYVNKIPCNECMPMLYQLGVKTVVLPDVDEKKKPDSESYFYKLLENDKICVFTQAKEKKKQE